MKKKMKKNNQVLQNLWAAFRTDALQAEASECLKYKDTKTPPFAWGAGDLVRPLSGRYTLYRPLVKPLSDALAQPLS
jgi:hypothetical protein